jgi:hypothetical protein
VKKEKDNKEKETMTKILVDRPIGKLSNWSIGESANW